MMRSSKWLLALALVAGLGQTARAGLIPASVTVTPDGGNFRFTYAVVLPTDMKLQSGDYFTIYDFAGLVPGTVATPIGWTYSSQNVGLLSGPTFVNPIPTSIVPSPGITPAFSANPWNRTPYVMQWNFGFQQEIPGGMVLSTDYVGSAGREPLRRPGETAMFVTQANAAKFKAEIAEY